MSVPQVVVDCTVVAKWYLSEDLSLQANQVYTSMATMLAPDLLLSQLGNVFLQKARLDELQPAGLAAALDSLHRSVSIEPSSPLIEAAVRLAFDYNRSFYDALYFALALDERCPLITADERLVNALKPTFGDSIVWLGDLPIA